MTKKLPGTLPDRLQPHNVEAEEAVLGSLLIDPDCIIRIATFLEPEDFYLERHGWVYGATRDMQARREPIDLVTLTDELERRNQLNEVGGSAYLAGLMNATPTPIHVEHYARIVERTAVRRRLIDAAGQIARLAYQDTDEAAAAVDRAEEIIFGVAARRAEGGLRPARAIMEEYKDRLEWFIQQDGKDTVGIPTGLAGLDKLMGGLQRSDMVVVAGRPGMGKTSLALGIALQAARKWQKRVAIFSLEMSDEQVVQRLVAARTGIDTQRLRAGKIRDEEWADLMAVSHEIASAGIFIDDTPAITPGDLRTRARRLHAEHGLDLLIVDYMQLMRGDRRTENRVQEVGAISRAIKALARELNVPVLALSQLSRGCESRVDKRPLLSDLRDSGDIEQDADVVMFIYRDEIYNPDTDYPGVAEIIVRKHRSGPTGEISAYFRKQTASFVDLAAETTQLNPVTAGAVVRNGNGRH